MSIKIMLVDDHAMVRSSIKRVLSAEVNLEVIAEAASATEALRLLRYERVNLVLLDIFMPGLSGISLAEKVQKLYPDVKVLVLTALTNEYLFHQLYNIGVAGIIHKSAGLTELVHAINIVVNGKRYIDADLAKTIVMSKLNILSNNHILKTLTTRELEIVLSMIQGKDIKCIADELHLDTKTISSYRSRIYKKLGVSNDVELTLFAWEQELLEVWL